MQKSMKVITPHSKMVQKVTKRVNLTRRMKEFIGEFEAQGCRITISCEKAKISRQTYYRWFEENPKFRIEVERSREKFKDFVEGEIINILKQGNVRMLKFYAETKLKDRGYVKKQEIEHIGESFGKIGININIPDSVKELLNKK